MLVLADIGFFIFHALLIAFNMLGWVWRRTRVWHLISMGLTSFSWFVMGAFYGWGYCICTDWHFEIRRKLGYEVTQSSYLQLLANDLLGITMSRFTSDVIAVSGYLFIVLATAIVWSRELHLRRSSRPMG